MLLIGLIASTTAVVRAEEGRFDSNGVTIRYVVEGEGEPVVLIHGWMADSSMWGRDSKGNTKLKASNGFQLIALDCRGHGQSGKPHDVASYGVEMAKDVVRLLDHLKIAKANLVGYSMGAFIVAKVAAENPDRVLRAVYGGQAPLLTGKAWQDAAEVAVFARAVEEGKGLGNYILEVTPPDRPKPTPQQADAYANFLFKGKDVKALAAAGKSFRHLRVDLEKLKSAKIPTLFVYGSLESVELKSRVERLCSALTRCRQVIVEKADHTTTLMKPEFGAAIETFLRTILKVDSPGTNPCPSPNPKPWLMSE